MWSVFRVRSRNNEREGDKMARADETIVQEWLNRRGYFTIRSLKKGRTECDLLAVSLQNSDAVHVEVNVSINPIGWIGKRDLSGQELLGARTEPTRRSRKA